MGSWRYVDSITPISADRGEVKIGAGLYGSKEADGRYYFGARILWGTISQITDIKFFDNGAQIRSRVKYGSVYTDDVISGVYKVGTFYDEGAYNVFSSYTSNYSSYENAVLYLERYAATLGIISNVVAEKNGNSINLSWDCEEVEEMAGAEPTKFAVYRSVNGGTQEYVRNITQNNTTDIVKSEWEDVQYFVRANNWYTSSYNRIPSNIIILIEPPSIPTSINVLGVKSGENTTVIWGESTDPASKPISYSLERSVNGGNYSVIYTGNGFNHSELIQKSWNNLQYRVRAFNTKLYSGYNTSQLLEVIHNIVPTIPSSLTVPELRSGRDSIISWGASTDIDNDQVTYNLQRSVNNSTWQNIYTGSDLNYLDTPLISWNTVKYRVRAFDGMDFSDFRTGVAVIVRHFILMKYKKNNQLYEAVKGWTKDNDILREVTTIRYKINNELKEV